MVPAARGGQKQQALKRPAASPALKRPAAASLNPDLRKRPAGAGKAYRVTHRYQPEKDVEAYILYNGKWFLSLKARVAGDACHDIVEKLAAELNSGQLEGKEAAQARLLELQSPGSPSDL